MEKAKKLLKKRKIIIRKIQIMKCKMKIFRKLSNKSHKILSIQNNRKNKINKKIKLKILNKMMRMTKQTNKIQLINTNNF